MHHVNRNKVIHMANLIKKCSVDIDTFLRCESAEVTKGSLPEKVKSLHEADEGQPARVCSQANEDSRPKP